MTLYFIRKKNSDKHFVVSFFTWTGVLSTTWLLIIGRGDFSTLKGLFGRGEENENEEKKKKNI